jgi:hypothetical protein
MTPDKTMEDHARDCVRLACGVKDPVVREQLMQMAREWMAAAMDEENLREPKSPHHQGTVV